MMTDIHLFFLSCAQHVFYLVTDSIIQISFFDVVMITLSSSLLPALPPESSRLKVAHAKNRQDYKELIQTLSQRENRLDLDECLSA